MLFYRTLGKDEAFGRSEGALFNKVQNGQPSPYDKKPL